MRASATVAPEETGWRVEAHKQWLWAFVGDQVTVYLIAGRGYEDAQRILGEEFSGVLARDGWAPYRRFQNARHQTCAAHLLRRAEAMIADSIAGQARVPHQLKRIPKDALLLRDRRDRREEMIDAEEFGLAMQEIDIDQTRPPAAELQPGLALSDAGQPAPHAQEITPAARELEPSTPGLDQDELARRVTELQERTGRLGAMHPTHEPNRRLLAHLTTPNVEATNWRAKQALRPAIVNRNSWGGNRSWAGAHTQQLTMSVIRTARKQQQDPIELMAKHSFTAPPPSAIS